MSFLDVSCLDELELGRRAAEYLSIENSDWAYKMWFASCRFWWDADSRSFIRETRPEMLRFTLPSPSAG